MRKTASWHLPYPHLPSLKASIDTIEGGENLASDEDRLREHGQKDHYKTFGTDLIEYINTKFAKFEALLLNDSALKKRLEADHNARGVVFWCVK